MSRKGNCGDVCVESFFVTLKADEITTLYEAKEETHRHIAT
ncbi:MAG: hypothetical protein ACYDHY_05330 [Acidiferrobacterales bacterium]